ncbi:hypothetical protein LINPERPRIM_LOCUS12452 [Linum perenne]
MPLCHVLGHKFHIYVVKATSTGFLCDIEGDAKQAPLLFKSGTSTVATRDANIP